jgi:hypothetical protein
MTERISAPMHIDTLIAEYAEMRSFGESIEGAAKRLGMSVNTMERRFERAGYQWRETAA